MANKAALKFHVPIPLVRPGEQATFDHLDIPEAGVVSRPDSAETEARLRHLPYTLIRVLDHDV